jgi:hypothetical protein
VFLLLLFSPCFRVGVDVWFPRIDSGLFWGLGFLKHMSLGISGLEAELLDAGLGKPNPEKDLSME